MPYYSLGPCLFDFVPNVACGVGAFCLVRMARIALGRRCVWLMKGGVLFVFLGGLLKAIWKLLYAFGLGDVRALSEAQFVLLAPGFLLMLIGIVILRRGSRPVEERRPADRSGVGTFEDPVPDRNDTVQDRRL